LLLLQTLLELGHTCNVPLLLETHLLQFGLLVLEILQESGNLELVFHLFFPFLGALMHPLNLLLGSLHTFSLPPLELKQTHITLGASQAGAKHVCFQCSASMPPSV
jgi:hypothetical protein